MTLKTENEFITSILENKITISEILDASFQPSWLKNNFEIFEYIQNYWGDNKNLPTLDLIQTRFPLFETVEIKNNPKELLLAIKKGSELDRINQDLKRAITLLQNSGDVRKVRDYLTKQLEKYTDSDIQDVYNLTDPKFTLSDTYKKRNDAFLTNGQVGIPTGFGKELDSFLNGGLTEGNLYYILGYSGIGKSWSNLILGRSAIENGKNVLFAGLESLLEKEYYRFLTVMTEISNTGLLSGKINLQDFIEKEKELKERARANFYLATWGDREDYTVRDILRNVNKYKPDLLLVDYLSLLTKNSKEEGWKDLKGVSKALKAIAVGKKIPVVAIVQSNSSTFDKEEITIDSSSESKGINTDADFMLGITKVKGKNNMLRINSAKERDSENKFSGIYQTNWDSGKIKFLTFDNGENEF